MAFWQDSLATKKRNLHCSQQFIQCLFTFALLFAGFVTPRNMDSPSVIVNTSYESMVQNPCFDPREFTNYVGQTTMLSCEFEYESHINVTAVTWSRQLQGGTTETFYSNGVFHTDKEFVVGAQHLTNETNVTTTRFAVFC